MKLLITFISVFIFAISNVMSQDTLLWLKNNSGIVEDELGSVILWENQIEEFGDAVQSNSELGGEQRQETYPGKVNVGFSKNGSFLELEESAGYFSDNSFSVFYVGKVGDVGSVAALFGNFKVVSTTNWNNCSGLRFVRKSNGDIAFQYGKPGYIHMVLNNLPEDAFFFFGFSLDETGSYSYFDNSSDIVKTGKIDGSIVHNTDKHVINLAHQQGASYTYDHTEVAELLVFDDAMSIAQLEDMQARMTVDYPELIVSDFSVEEVLPEDRTKLSPEGTISMTFSQNIDASSSLPKVYVDKNELEASGSWSVSSNELTYTNNVAWPLGALVKVQLDEGLKSTDGVSVDIASRSEYNFIVETGVNYGEEIIKINPMTTVDYPQDGHKLPLYVVLPEQRSQKVPVHIWVHGGGWSGGTAAASSASFSPHGTYLAENLGIATLGISYRCNGSSGNFTLAMEDIHSAYQWAVANAATYNFDMTKLFFSGGSAGSPLAALAAQRYATTVGFIGFNGVYDFVNDQGSFGQWNGYGQEDPSAEANSAIFQLRSNPPATILMHGYDDTTIPYTQSTLFADKINASGGEAKAVIYPGQVHAFFNIGKEEYEDVLYEMANFMDEVVQANEQDTNSDQIMMNSTRADDFIIYPNPVPGGASFTLQTNSELSSRGLKIEIATIFGQLVQDELYTLNQDTGTFCIDTRNLGAGAYFVSISGENFSSVRKIIIQ